MAFHVRKHPIGCSVEKLNRRDMRLEEAMRNKLPEGFFVGHQGLGRALLEVTEQVPHAVAAVQGAADDMVHAEATFTLLDRIPEARVSFSLGHRVGVVLRVRGFPRWGAKK